MLSWSTVDTRDKPEAKNELSNALDAIKWGTDYLIKAHPQPNFLYGQVGDGGSDHSCWERPEDMDTSRLAYKIDEEIPGSDLAAETAAAFAAASVAFAPVDHDYAYNLQTQVKQVLHLQLFAFARDYNGLYQQSITGAGEFYSSSGYQDELVWASSWLHRATSNKEYLDFLSNQNDDGGTRTMFLWDECALVLEGKVKPADDYNYGSAATWADDMKTQAEQFICNCLQKGDNNIKMTPGGLLWFKPWNNLQYTNTAAFIATIYSKYSGSHSSSIVCSSGVVQPSDLALHDHSENHASSYFLRLFLPVDYILGSNPKNMSCMVGSGSNYPTQVHHRGASIVSLKRDPTHVSCKAGYNLWFNKNSSDPNVLVGAIVGGPDQNYGYTDSRSNFQVAEPTTVTTAPLFGVLARLA
ncbi:Glycoside hydrolase [Trema orientale]|uniref:cellulase n=1 Tax=Trema orientale TaxID=63057 RepID=A0A2P5FBF7_TREOI|nr:Glycoside hydrolase [Trema orientale]